MAVVLFSLNLVAIVLGSCYIIPIIFKIKNNI